MRDILSNDSFIGPDLLRKPHRQAEPERSRVAQGRFRVRGNHRRGGRGSQAEAQDQVGRAGSTRRQREADSPDRGRLGPTLRAATGSDGRQGDGRLHEPPDLCGPLQRTHQAPSRLGQCPGRRHRSREEAIQRREDRDDRQRRRWRRLAAAHPQQATPQGSDHAIQGHERPVPHRYCPRHVADRLRRPLPPHDVRRQADARPRTDAGHRPREPSLPRQAGRVDRRLPGTGRSVEAGIGDLHRERRPRLPHHRHGSSGRRAAGEVRSLLRPDARLRLVEMDDRHVVLHLGFTLEGLSFLRGRFNEEPIWSWLRDQALQGFELFVGGGRLSGQLLGKVALFRVQRG